MELYTFRLPSWNELPPMPLYLEQVINLVNGVFIMYDDKGSVNKLTKTMVSNYVKQSYIKAPINKKYDKESIAALMVIALLKNVLPINQVSELISKATDNGRVQECYGKFCKILQGELALVFNPSSEEAKRANEEYTSMREDDMWRLCHAACRSFASQLFVKSMIIAIETDEDVEE